MDYLLPPMDPRFYIDPRMGRHSVGLFVDKCWQVRVICVCGNRSFLPVSKLIKLPQEVPVSEVVGRLKCSRCGSTEGVADVLQDRGATQVKTMAEYHRRVKPGDRQ